jgi:hypothetical protein
MKRVARIERVMTIIRGRGMSRHFVHWYTPDREHGPGRFIAAGEPYRRAGGPLDGREMGGDLF